MGTAIIQVDWAEILRTKGVRAKGYGIVPKYAMQDTSLTIEAKAIYAYLCSLSGDGSSAYPSVDTIRSHLKIGEYAYTAHMKLLIKTGYIERTQIRENGKTYAHNLYRMTKQPRRYIEEESQTPRDRKVADTVRQEGILGGGYGQIPRMVMYDSRLSIKAKALYAYFTAFTGGGETAFPRMEQICRELGITKTSYYKYRDELSSLDYLSIQQEKQDGHFAANRYRLNAMPGSDAVPFPKNPGTIDPGAMGPGAKAPAAKDPESIGPGTKVPRTKGPQATDPGITTNTATINTPTINSSDDHHSYQPYLPSERYARMALMRDLDRIDGLSREELKDHLFDVIGVTMDHYGPSIDPAIVEREQALVTVMADYIAARRPYDGKDLHISYEEMVVRLLQLDYDDIREVAERISEFVAVGDVRSPKAYAMRALYEQSVARELGPSLL